MGLFDVFTGDSAKKAAEENRKLLLANQTTGTNTLTGGQTSALGALDDASAAYDPLKSLAGKYGGATSLQLDALGVNGADGNTRAVNAFQAGPGYQYAVDQSTDAVARKANALGLLNGGNTVAAISDRAGNMANQEYGSWLDRLGGYISPELSATAGAASGAAGTDMAKAGVYQDTAGKIAGLGTTTTNGVAGQNTQEANAVMQGSGNLWNLGLNAAKAFATGGTSLLGDLGSMGTNMMNNGGRFNPIAGMTGR
jgi:hypothetical protein